MSDLSRELREALDDPKRYEWGGPWEHLGDAERDVRRLLDDIESAERQLADMREALDPVVIARAFHENYERLAPAFGYETRSESAVPWDEVPEQNRALMVATVGAVLASALTVSPADTTEAG